MYKRNSLPKIFKKDYVKDIEATVMRERKREEREGERGREEGIKRKSEEEIQATNKTMEEESGRVLISFKWRVNQ